MRKIERQQEPLILAQNKVEWTKEVTEGILNDTELPTDVWKRHKQNGDLDDVVNAIKQDTHAKCMYCESAPSATSILEIEHFRPKRKTKYPDKTFSWENLGYACRNCNRNKGSLFDEDLPFIDPYSDNPHSHFVAVGLLIRPRLNDRRAKLTHTQIDLDRPDLRDSRVNRFLYLERLANEWQVEDNQVLKANLFKLLTYELNDDKPYTFTVRPSIEAMIVVG